MFSKPRESGLFFGFFKRVLRKVCYSFRSDFINVECFMASSYAGEVANWISMKLSDAYHGAANTLANRTGDESIRRGKSMLEEAIDNELKAVLEEWKKTPPQAINPNVLSQEAATNVTNKLKTTPSTLSTRDNALLGAIITATGDIALNDAAQSMFEKLNNTVATATE